MKSNHPHNAPNWNALWAELVIEELVRCGLDTICLSPGSRSTPLVVAAARHKRLRLKVHVDERGAAFFALGHGRATGKPAAWITTSGTAAANGLPAVIEAAQDGIPLVCITADRPPELRDTAANQAIDQVGLFGRYPRWQFDVPPPSGVVHPNFLLTAVDQAVHRATGIDPGPVHLNMMFRDPLAPDGAGVGLQPDLNAWWAGDSPYTRYATSLAMADTAALVQALAPARRGVIIAGRGPAACGQAASDLASALQWPLIADIGSGQRLGESGQALIRYSDLVLSAHRFAADHRPDAVIQFGRPAVSKRLARWLAEASPAVYAVVASTPDRIDPRHHVTHRLIGHPVSTATVLSASLTPGEKPWLAAWREADRRAANALNALLADRLSEPAVAARVAALTPATHGLFLSSSMPIRDMDGFAGEGDRPLATGANRGASGIDGVVSSAAGFSDGLRAPVTLLIGDLALLHDLNGLAWLQSTRVVLVVINNDGGGIFSFLPIAAHGDVFETWFGTPHGRTFRSAAEMFDLPYEAPSDLDAFDAAYRRALQHDGSSVIEVQTNREQNLADHREMIAAVSSAIDA